MLDAILEAGTIRNSRSGVIETAAGQDLGLELRSRAEIVNDGIIRSSGNITINQRPLEEYFPSDQDRKAVLEVLDAVGKRGQVDVIVRVTGGGMTGQAGACRMGLARAL